MVLRFTSAMLAPPFAHLGHWYVSLPIFMGPVVLLAALVKISAWRERRRGATGAGRESRVTACERGDRALITVIGPLDYAALLDIEAELGIARHRARRAAVLDLRGVTTVEERAAVDLPGIVDTVAPELDVVALAAPVDVQQTLQRIGALDGIEVASGEGHLGPPEGPD
jgi:hypothetical protein